MTPDRHMRAVAYTAAESGVPAKMNPTTVWADSGPPSTTRSRMPSTTVPKILRTGLRTGLGCGHGVIPRDLGEFDIAGDVRLSKIH
jgi:hypothetical protein